MLQITRDNFFLWHNCVIITCAYFNGHLLGAPREYVLHGLDPGLDWGSCRSLLWAFFLFVLAHPVSCCWLPMAYVSHSNTPLPTRRCNTNVQVNNIAAVHHIHTGTHIYIAFISLFILFFYFFHPLGQAGWLRPFPSVTRWMSVLYKRNTTEGFMIFWFFFNS
jgi:hypothetical protein